jgi:hypothetical protein
VAVTPFACAKAAPEPPLARPFQAGQEGATGRQLNRALYGRNKKQLGTKTKLIWRFAQGTKWSMYRYTYGIYLKVYSVFYIFVADKNKGYHEVSKDRRNRMLIINRATRFSDFWSIQND